MPRSRPSNPRPPANLLNISNMLKNTTDFFQYEFEAIGTRWNIELLEPLINDIDYASDDVRNAEADNLKRAIDGRIRQFDKDYSRFRHDSLVSNMARKAGSYTLPADARPLLDFYQQLYTLSDGAVTPLIGQTLSDAGYDATYSFKPGVLTVPPTWPEVLDYQFPVLTLKQPALLDFGAAGKGYLVDIISELLTNYGLANYCIDAGGDIVYRTTTSQHLEVALEHPTDFSQAIGVASLYNQSLCGSAGNRRTWTVNAGRQTYHHILNPSKLTSPDHIRAVWVVADSGLVADGLATALFFVKPEALTNVTNIAKLTKPARLTKSCAPYSFEYAIIYKDMSLQHSAGFPATFFS